MIRLLIKLGVLAALVFPLQLGLGNLLGKERLPSRERLDRILSDRCDVVVFGDSVLRFVAPGDRDKRPLSDLLVEALRGRSVGIFQRDGSSLDLYEHYVAYLCGSPSRPREVVVLVNLRSFSPMWDLKPGFQFQVEKLRYRWGDALALGLLRPLSTFGLYHLNPLSEAEFKDQPVYCGSQRIGTVWEVEWGLGSLARRGAVERHFILSYMNPILRGHRKLSALVRLVRTCRSAGVRPIVYVTPVDVESGLQELGPELPRQVEKNVQTIQDALQREGVRLLDLSHSIAADDFDWKPSLSPHEHLNETGRKKVLQAVSLELLNPESR